VLHFTDHLPLAVETEVVLSAQMTEIVLEDQENSVEPTVVWVALPRSTAEPIPTVTQFATPASCVKTAHPL